MKLLEQLVKVRFFVAATLAIFVASSLAGSAGGRTLAILTLALEPLLLLGWTWAWHAYRKGTLAGFAALELEAVEAADGDLPQGLEQTRAELRSLGFRLAGQLRRRFPWQEWQPDWAFLERDGVSAAFLAPDRALTFATYWPDASLVVTAAGVRPLRIDLPMIEQRNVAGGQPTSTAATWTPARASPKSTGWPPRLPPSPTWQRRSERSFRAAAKDLRFSRPAEER